MLTFRQKTYYTFKKTSKKVVQNKIYKITLKLLIAAEKIHIAVRVPYGRDKYNQEHIGAFGET